METAELRYFLEFYFISSMDEDEDIKCVNKDLRQAGIDAEASRQKALGLIKKAKIDLKIKNEKEFEERLCTLMESSKIKLGEIEKRHSELALAFRKLSEKYNPNTDELLDDKSA